MSRAHRQPIVQMVLLLISVAGLAGFWFAHSRGNSTPKPNAAVADADADENLELPEAEREFLWQVEHHGNLLSQQGFKKLADALKRSDADAIAGFLAADFTAHILASPRESKLKSDIVSVVRQTVSQSPPHQLTRQEFVAKLVEYRRVFVQPPSVKIALMGLLPVKRDDPNGSWRGTAQLRLWGEHAPGKPAEVVLYLLFESQRPAAEFFERGGWLTACSIIQAQVGKAEHPLLRECAKERGIDPGQFHDNWKEGAEMGTVTGGVYLCDFDRDGWLDVLITDFTGIYLYKGLPGGRFLNVTADMGLPAELKDGNGWSVVAAFVDLDGDGWEDLILGDQLYRNDQGKRFVNVTARSNLRLPPHNTGIIVADYDRDGMMDLYVTRSGHGKASSWLSGKSGLRTGNQLWRNKGNWQFEDVTAQAGVDGGQRSTFTAVWFDANNDGWPDLFVPNEFGNGILYINNGDGTFRGRELTDYPCDFGTMGVTVGDVDNDGNIDIYCANMYSKAGSRVIGNLRDDAYPPKVLAKMRTFVTGSQLHRNRGGLMWEQKGKEWQVSDAGWAYGAALVDLDNDGWLDLYATAGYISKSRFEPDG
jgi:hypothetical protein